ncbi:MAG: DUF362 domain-containing protein [Candidatus Omnitrophica bacterium]|nr:DUF362 domain-containing protein [Candidatus Omnitrophota bacterium]
MKKRVVILKIDEYDQEALYARLKTALHKYFPLKEYFAEGDKILLKPNLLMAASPQEAVTTHPVFIEAIGRIFKEEGFPVSVADSPGGFVSDRDVDELYEETGIKKMAALRGFGLLYPTESIVRNNIPLCWWSEGFKMINLPKLKTHDIMVLTLATKNLYGCISGLHKSHLHHMHPKTDDFAKIITKLYSIITPSLNIVDGIVALQGHGPAKKGKPRKMGIVAIGSDALCIDYAISKLVGLNEGANPLIRQAKRENLFSEDGVGIVSEFGEQIFSDFEFPPPFIINRLPSALVRILRLFFKFKPVVDIARCTECAVCARVCPQGAITIEKGKKAHIDCSKCIMCMCCGEMCRSGAVDLDMSVLLKIVKALLNRGKNKKHECHKV